MPKKVAVVGLGAMGSMTAWALAERGAEVVGFDAFSSPHDRGAHGGESRMFRVAYLEGASYVPYLLRARERWLQLEEQSGTSLFHPAGSLLVASARNRHLVDDLSAAARADGLPVQDLDSTDLRARYPQLSLTGDEVGVLDTLGGVLKPERAVAAALGQAADRGARFHMNSHVDSVEDGPHGARVRVAGEDHLFDHVVVATGAWSAGLLPESFGDIVPSELYLAWFLAGDGAQFLPATFPGTAIKLDGMDDLPVGICLFPSMDGVLVKAGETIGGFDPVGSPGEIGRFVDPARLERLSKWVSRVVPDLRPGPVRVSVYVDGFSSDTRPRIASSAHVTALAGFSGHGFKLSAAVGEIAAAAAVDGDLSNAEPMFHLSARS